MNVETVAQRHAAQRADIHVHSWRNVRIEPQRHALEHFQRQAKRRRKFALGTLPPCQFYQAYINECVIPYETKINVDYSIGLKLPQLMMDAGLRPDFVVADQPLFKEGPEKNGSSSWRLRTLPSASNWKPI
jgi:hypothetical protein